MAPIYIYIQSHPQLETNIRVYDDQCAMYNSVRRDLNAAMGSPSIHTIISIATAVQVKVIAMATQKS